MLLHHLGAQPKNLWGGATPCFLQYATYHAVSGLAWIAFQRRHIGFAGSDHLLAVRAVRNVLVARARIGSELERELLSLRVVRAPLGRKLQPGVDLLLIQRHLGNARRHPALLLELTRHVQGGFLFDRARLANGAPMANARVPAADVAEILIDVRELLGATGERMIRLQGRIDHSVGKSASHQQRHREPGCASACRGRAQ